MQNHVTLSFKVIRKGNAFSSSWGELPETKYLEKKQIIRCCSMRSS